MTEATSSPASQFRYTNIHTPNIVTVSWTDSTSSAEWFDQDELREFIEGRVFHVRSVGYLVSQDTEQITLASRLTTTGKQVGLIERIPRAAIESIQTIPTHTPTLPPDDDDDDSDEPSPRDHDQPTPPRHRRR